jgi:hypothetical protein
MKNLFASSAAAAVMTLISAPSFAQFQAADEFVVTAAKVDHVEVSPLCPPNAFCVTSGTRVELSFAIPCGGYMGPISTKLIAGERGLPKLVVSAVAVHNPEFSRRAFCSQAFATEILSFPLVKLGAEDVIDLNAK